MSGMDLTQFCAARRCEFDPQPRLPSLGHDPFSAPLFRPCDSGFCFMVGSTQQSFFKAKAAPAAKAVKAAPKAAAKAAKAAPKAAAKAVKAAPKVCM